MYELGLRCGVLSFQGALLPHFIRSGTPHVPWHGFPVRHIFRERLLMLLSPLLPGAQSSVCTAPPGAEQDPTPGSADRGLPGFCAAIRLPGGRQAAAGSEESAPVEATHSSAVTGEAFVDFYFSPLRKKKINLLLKTLYSKYKNAFVRWRCF